MNPNMCCGSCSWSFENKPQFCPNNVQTGVQSDGGWAQYCVVKDFMVSSILSSYLYFFPLKHK